MIRSTFSLVLALALVAAAPGYAQDATEPGPWKYNAIVGLNLAQSAFSNNWAGGDRGSLAWVTNADLGAERQFNPKFHWDNTLILRYGETADQVQDPDNADKNKWDRPKKSTDQIQLDSMGRFTLGSFVDPYLALRGESQFVDESDPRGSLTLHPTTLSESGGVARAFVKEDDRQVVSRLGLALRQTFARTFKDLSGDETENFTTADGGLEFKTNVTYPLAGDRIIYKGELFLFWAVFFNESGALEDFDRLALEVDPTRESVQDFWQDPKVNWQNDFTSQITSWLNVNLYFQLVYDKFDASTKIISDFDPTNPIETATAIGQVDAGIRKSGQFKQTLAIGLSYRFI